MEVPTLVKGNMPTLYRKLKKLPWAAIPSVSSVTTGHGRLAGEALRLEGPSDARG
jgi:hypothetical protein